MPITQAKAKTKYVVPTHWLPIWPQRGRHARFWLIVATKVRERNIPKRDHARVRSICREVEALLAREQLRAREMGHGKTQG